MALVSLKYTGTAKYFETPITGSQQCWVPGQSSFVDSSYLAAFLATGNFVKFERDPVYEQDGALIDKDNTPLSTSGGVASIQQLRSGIISGVTYDGINRVTGYNRNAVAYTVTYPTSTSAVITSATGAVRNVTLDGAQRVTAVL